MSCLLILTNILLTSSMPASLQISIFIAASLDGFIARSDGGIDWLTDPSYEIPNEDFGYQSFMNSVDALVMGRHTYEKVLTFGEWPYKDKHVIVLSQNPRPTPEDLTSQVEWMGGTPTELINQLTQRGYQHIYLDGGKTIQWFLREGLVDRMTITRIPILLGEGLPLFGATGHDIRFRHEQTTTYPNGMVQSTYRRTASEKP